MVMHTFALSLSLSLSLYLSLALHARKQLLARGLVMGYGFYSPEIQVPTSVRSRYVDLSQVIFKKA